jgi:hypothetical protein
MVSWSSWLWHLVNTEVVPGSIPGEINFFSSSIFGLYIQQRIGTREDWTWPTLSFTSKIPPPTHLDM